MRCLPLLRGMRLLWHKADIAGFDYGIAPSGDPPRTCGASHSRRATWTTWGLAFDAKRQSTLLEHFQHRHVIRQDLGDQFLESGFPRNRSEMMHEGRAETLPLILIDHGESDLGLSRLRDDVACAARDHWHALFVDDCDQRDVIDEIDAQEIVDFDSVKLRLTAKKRR